MKIIKKKYNLGLFWRKETQLLSEYTPNFIFKHNLTFVLLYWPCETH